MTGGLYPQATCHPEQSEGSPDQLYKMCIKGSSWERGIEGVRSKINERSFFP